MVMLIPNLQTERLTIREFAMDDLETIHRILNEGFGGSAPATEHQHWLDWITRNYRELDKLNQPPYGDRAIVREGCLIGSVGLVP
jgi:hypothetical protein